MNNEITSMAEIAESDWDGESSPDEPSTNATATTESDAAKMEFFVQMRSWTMADIETLIVEAAAARIVGRIQPDRLSRMVEERAIEMFTEKANAVLDGITDEILDKPLMPKLGTAEPPLTMREFLGLTGRQYLDEAVDRDGKPTKSQYERVGTRMQTIVSGAMDRKFKTEIEKATNAAITEVRAAVMKQHAEFLAGEKSRLRQALEKTLG